MERTARIRVRARKSIKLEFNISEIIDQVYWPPCPPRGSKQEEPDRKLPENFKYYEKWGFTIYRTYYGPHSDQYWNILLGALKQQTLLALGYYEDQDDDQEDLERVKKLFHLDAREDASLLEGLDVRGICEVCMKEDPCDRTNAARRYHHVLLADESVLNDIATGESVVKAVDFYGERPGESWGWMRIPTGYLLELCHSLWLWEDNLYRALRYDGSEEEGLERYIWSGEDAAPPTSQCSEMRPLCKHYEAQRPMFGVHKPSILKRKRRD